MDENLAACLWPLWLRFNKRVIDEEGNVTTKIVEFLAPPPTVAQAIMLYALLPHYEDKSHAVRLEPVIHEWLGGTGVLEYMDSQKLAAENRANMYYDFLQKAESAGKVEEEEEKVDRRGGWSREMSLSLMVAEYRAWYRESPLNEPWPYFLNQLHYLQKVKSECALGNLTWYLSARSMKDDGIESLYKQAGYKKKSGFDELNAEEMALVEASRRRVEAQASSAQDLVRLMHSTGRAQA